MHHKRPNLISRRGLTLLEVILAVVLLAVVASAALSISSAIIGFQIREQRTLAAAELANRLLLQFLDDENSLPSPSAPLEYGAERYRWTMSKDTVTTREARPDTASTTQSNSTLKLDRIVHVRVKVWLSEESGGDMSPDQGQPQVTLSRLIDPLAVVSRNPDSASKLLSDEQRRRQFMEQVTGAPSGGGGGSRPGTGSGGGNRGGGGR